MEMDGGSTLASPEAAEDVQGALQHAEILHVARSTVVSVYYVTVLSPVSAAVMTFVLYFLKQAQVFIIDVGTGLKGFSSYLQNRKL